MITKEEIAGLDPKIRNLVLLINQIGYTTTDSGDGSKFGQMEGALNIPHVVIQLPQEDRTKDALIKDAFILWAILKKQLKAEARPRLNIEISYSIKDNLGLFIVSGINDDDLLEDAYVYG